MDAHFRGSMLLSNDMRISCRRSCPCPHKLAFHSALKELAARAGLRAPAGLSAACAG